jgi:hypothetical protein
MTNDDIRMTNQIRSSNDEWTTGTRSGEAEWDAETGE